MDCGLDIFLLYANKGAIYTNIGAIKTRLFLSPVSDPTDKQIKLNLHYFRAQLVYNLKGLHDLDPSLYLSFALTHEMINVDNIAYKRIFTIKPGKNNELINSGLCHIRL